MFEKSLKKNLKNQALKKVFYNKDENISKFFAICCKGLKQNEVSFLEILI